MELLKVAALSDFANVYSAVSNWQPRSVDRLENLPLCFVRDLSHRVNYTFLAAEFDIADTSTKTLGGRHLFYLVRDSRRFVLSFAGRVKLKLEENAGRSSQEEELPPKEKR